MDLSIRVLPQHVLYHRGLEPEHADASSLKRYLEACRRQNNIGVTPLNISIGDWVRALEAAGHTTNVTLIKIYLKRCLDLNGIAYGPGLTRCPNTIRLSDRHTVMCAAMLHRYRRVGESRFVRDITTGVLDDSTTQYILDRDRARLGASPFRYIYWYFDGRYAHMDCDSAFILGVHLGLPSHVLPSPDTRSLLMYARESIMSKVTYSHHAYLFAYSLMHKCGFVPTWHPYKREVSMLETAMSL